MSIGYLRVSYDKLSIIIKQFYQSIVIYEVALGYLGNKLDFI